MFERTANGGLEANLMLNFMLIPCSDSLNETSLMCVDRNLAVPEENTFSIILNAIAANPAMTEREKSEASNQIRVLHSVSERWNFI